MTTMKCSEERSSQLVGGEKLFEIYFQLMTQTDDNDAQFSLCFQRRSLKTEPERAVLTNDLITTP